MTATKLFPVNLKHQSVHLTRKWLPLFAQVRSQQTAAASKTSPSSAQNADSEWNCARPYSEIPTETTFKFIKKFLPGGKYKKMDTTQLIMALKEDYGDIFLMPSMMGRAPNLFTYNVDDFQKVFRNEGIWPHRPSIQTLHYHRSVHRADLYQGVEGIMSTQDEKWGRFRSAVNPVLMNPKNVRLYLSKMSEVNLDFIERIKKIRDPQTLEVPASFEEEINHWTLESVSVVALDKQLGLLRDNCDNTNEAKEMFAHLTEFFTLTYELEVKPSLWKYLSTPKFKRLMKALDGIQTITTSYVNEAIERLEREDVEKPDNEKSVLEKLLKIDKKVATVMAMDMLMAGVDTTSTTFVGIMLCLAMHPDKQQQLREEIMQILPTKDAPLTEHSMNSIPYLRACIKESMRIYPLIIGNGRFARNDIVLSGYQVPKGTQVTMISTAILKDEKLYPRAKEFLPERWLREDKEKQQQQNASCPNALKGTNPFAFLPFGFGPRVCIGRRIVEMELEVGLARILRNFKVEFNYPTENAFKSLLINVPNIPLKFKFIDLQE